MPKPRDGAAVAREIAEMRASWLAEWQPRLTDAETPLSPYRVIWDLLHTVDIDNTIITHDAGSPRDQLSPFWVSRSPHSYIGWGKTTQLGYGLGLAMGAKLAQPDKLCINVWGDAAIGFTGMDFETAARNNIPILSVLFNNFSMACELHIMGTSTEKYRATDISGNYADFARALGGHGERVTEPAQIIPAIKRGIAETRNGKPALLEFAASAAHWRWSSPHAALIWRWQMSTKWVFAQWRMRLRAGTRIRYSCAVSMLPTGPRLRRLRLRRPHLFRSYACW